MTPRKKLIEVALPLEAINRAAEEEKSVPRKGHPATLHLWWARRPLAACRAVLFASIVDDPSSHPETFPTEESQEAERQRLFGIIEELVKWENSNNERVLKAARQEIRNATAGQLPPVLDPFCGGGSIPLEAQRLGLAARASDLNPVAVLITKALIEIPPKFANRPPVNPEARESLGHSGTWKGAQGLAEDVLHYGQWMRAEAEKRIGRLYPMVTIPRERGAGEATVIAWLWARTVKCPSPACVARTPLVRSFLLSARKGHEAWVEPVFRPADGTLSFDVKTGLGKPRQGTVNRRGASCASCGSPFPLEHVRAEGKLHRLQPVLMAVVAERPGGRIYLSPDLNQETWAAKARPGDVLETDLPSRALGFRVQAYGMTRHRDLFTPRQLVALETFSDLVTVARDRVISDALAAGWDNAPKDLANGGAGAVAYGDAITVYLAFAVDKLADWSSTICGWMPPVQKIRNTFARQAIPMTWDFAEVNPFSQSVGNFLNHIDWVSRALAVLPAECPGVSLQLDASESIVSGSGALVVTDPPYYDNIGYADLSDFFYVWLRRSCGKIYPDLFSTLLTPKTAELVATPYRFDGDRAKADEHFEMGLTRSFERLRQSADDRFPSAVFYAFKQAESDDDEEATVASTGWETMLEGLLGVGLSVVGTWPIRTERSGRSVSIGTNALASSVVLVCRQRSSTATIASRREFVAALNQGLPKALQSLRHGSIAPVDLAQAAIGPGMAVFSSYAKVVEADGSRMTIRTALTLINQALDQVLAEQEGEFDSDTRFAVAWFEQFGFEPGSYGVAEVLSKAKDIGLRAMEAHGILEQKRGKVRLLKREELPDDWDPAGDDGLTLWEVCQNLILKLENGGEGAAAELLRKVGSFGGAARDLAYRLYQICDRKGWSPQAQPYNALVVAWPEISRLASVERAVEPRPGELFQ